MKITVKKAAAVMAVKKLSAGISKKDTPIIITVVKTKTGYVGSFRADGDVQVFTRFACKTDADGEVQMVVPTMFVTAFNSLARLGDEVTFEFTDSGVELFCGSGRLTVPKLSQDVPAQLSIGNPVGSVTIPTVQLKEALSVKNFIVPAKDSASWVNCVGMKVADGGVRFIGSCTYGLMICDEVSEVEGLVGSSLAVPVLLLNKVTALLDGENVVMHVFGRKEEVHKKVSEIVKAEDGTEKQVEKGVIREIVTPTHVSVVDADAVYVLPLCAMPYGNIDAIVGGVLPGTRFKASLLKRDFVNAISIVSASGSEVFTVDVVDGKLRVADEAGINYVDVESEYEGSYVKSKFACIAVLNGVAGMGDRILLRSNSSVERKYADMFLFISPAVEDGEPNVLAMFSPIANNAEAQAQTSQIKKKAAAEKADAEESAVSDVE